MTPVIYQIIPRLFANPVPYGKMVRGGSILENGTGKMSGISTSFLGELRKSGFTHIWCTGLLEHATQTAYPEEGIPHDHPALVKGRAGSPYAVKDYYDIDPDLADEPHKRMEEFQALLRRTHRQGLRLIMDFIPNHVFRQYHSDRQPKGTLQIGQEDDFTKAFLASNNFYYVPGVAFSPRFSTEDSQMGPYREFPAKVTGNDRFDANPSRDDWYETVKLNYGVDYMDYGARHFDPIPDTWIKMRDILLFWAQKGVDAFRCDMAEMVPVEFWEWAIREVKKHFPETEFIAEVYNPSLYQSYIHRGGFDYLYDKVGLYDTLRNVITSMAPASDISAAIWSIGGFQEHMLAFLENHDEQRIASDFFAVDPWKAVPGMMVAALMTRGALMVYAGQEIGERGMDQEGFSGRDGRTTIFDYWSPESLGHYMRKGRFSLEGLTEPQAALREAYIRILRLKNEPAIARGALFDLTYCNRGRQDFDERRQLAFLRKLDHDLILVAVNFAPWNTDVTICLPSHAFEYLGIGETDSTQATDLLTGKTEQISLSSLKGTHLSLPMHGGKVLKINIE